jgi:hypothetical protein
MQRRGVRSAGHGGGRSEEPDAAGHAERDRHSECAAADDGRAAARSTRGSGVA